MRKDELIFIIVMALIGFFGASATVAWFIILLERAAP